MKKLKYSNLQFQPGPPGARALLTVKFMDDDGEVYNWMPKWAEAEELFLKAINTESFNKPESEWLPRLANAVQETAQAANQPIQQARKIYGQIDHLEEWNLVIQEQSRNGSEFSAPPLFPVDYEFLTTWLGRYVTAIEINNVIVKLLYQPGYDEDEMEEYPPRTATDDLPF